MQEEAVATSIKGPGEKLKSARESLGLSIWDVASQLYLSERVIQALEEDDYHDGLPVRAFVRGYVQSYSKLLNLPPEGMLAEFDSMGIYKKPQEENMKPLVQPRVVLTVHKDKFWFAVVGGSLLGILILIVVITWFNTHKEKQADMVNQTLQEETLLDQAQIMPPVPPQPSVMVIPPVASSSADAVASTVAVETASLSSIEPEIQSSPKNKAKNSAGNKKSANKKPAASKKVTAVENAAFTDIEIHRSSEDHPSEPEAPF